MTGATTGPTKGPRARRRGEHCPSALRLDQWLAGELSAAEAASIEAHAGSCTVCQSEREARLETRRQFAQQAPSFASLERAARRRRGRWFAGVGVLAAAAALLLFVSSPWRAELGSAERGTRIKGSSASLGYVVRRASRVFAAAPGERLQPGDAVRFTVSASEPVFVALLGLDASGRLSVYHPDAEQLSALGPGKDQPLPAAVALNETSGDERLYAVFCREAVAVSALRSAIERAPDAPALPAGCRYERRSWFGAPP